MNPRWTIRHETIYRYSTPVVLAPHVLRLIPRADSVRVSARSIRIAPPPLDVSEYVDELGNSYAHVTFSAVPSSELVVTSHLEVESLSPPLRDASLSLPALPWAPPYPDALAAFRQPDSSAEVSALAQRLSAEVGHAPLPFFEHLCRTLFSTLDRQIRVDGAAQTPAETLRTGRGACRDLTVLFLAACRAQGVAGRFVSGYQGQEASPDGRRHLHAWPEVFVPGVGWLGWDPTHGVPAGTGHIALAAGPEQAATMAVEGGYYFDGPSLTSTLDYSITFEAR